MGEMTIEKILQLLSKGCKLTHETWDEGKYIYYNIDKCKSTIVNEEDEYMDLIGVLEYNYVEGFEVYEEPKFSHWLIETINGDKFVTKEKYKCAEDVIDSVVLNDRNIYTITELDIELI